MYLTTAWGLIVPVCDKGKKLHFSIENIQLLGFIFEM